MKTKQINFKLTEKQHNKLRSAAAEREISMTQLLIELINKLPDPPNKDKPNV